jgi:hypothetical protein
MQIKLILEEKRKKTAIGQNGTKGNRTKPILSNQIDGEDPDNSDAIRENEYKEKTLTQDINQMKIDQ